MKNDTADVYRNTLEIISVPNYEACDNAKIACSVFITKHDCVANTIPLFKTMEKMQKCMLIKKSIKKPVTEFKELIPEKKSNL